MTHYGKIKKTDIANGPGVRVSVFLSGCPHHCEGCFNPETWDSNYGNEFDANVLNEITLAMVPDHIQGVTILGGEPMSKDNQPATLLICARASILSKDIWIYTGYRFEDLLVGGRAHRGITDRILEYADCIVDGPFMKEQKEAGLLFKGSRNQRIINVKRTIKEGAIVLYEH